MCHLRPEVRASEASTKSGQLQWDLYRKLVREGWRLKPFTSRNFPLLMVEVSASFKNVKKVQGAPPVRRWLDEIHEGKLCPPGRVPGNAPYEAK
jgi:hypothetical protein